MKRIIDEDDIINEGHLVNSIAMALGIERGVIVGQVGTNLTYARFQEFGTVPHFVPFHLAESLYNQAVGDWGWLPVDKTASRRLNAAPDPKVMRTNNGRRMVTGRTQTFLKDNPDTVGEAIARALCPDPKAQGDEDTDRASGVHRPRGSTAVSGVTNGKDQPKPSW